MGVKITVIQKSHKMNDVETNIIDSINGYLIKNKSAVSDFNLIKDIVDRNIDNIDDEINTTMPMPLYLGLAGTMIGIILGLFFMPSLNADDFENSIDMLLGGVKIAMLASIVGLLLTVINSGHFYKKAKLKVEKRRNDFYTFLQTQLLPVMSQNVSSSIISLQNNLIKFNESFSDNMTDFNIILLDIKESFDSQVKVMKEIEQIDVVSLAKLNVNVLKELRSSVKKFEVFNDYLGQLNTFVENAQVLNSNISLQLKRTNEIGEIAGHLKSNIDNNKALMSYLNSEMNEIQSRKQIISNAVVDVDNALSDSFDGLGKTIEEKIESIKKITIKEEELLGDMLQDRHGNLDELKKLGSIKTGITNLEETISKNNQEIIKLFKAIQKQNHVSEDQNSKLRKYMEWIYVGLGVISVVLLLWVLLG